MSESNLLLLSCPYCGGKLTLDGESYLCDDCQHRFAKKKIEDADAKMRDVMNRQQAEQIAQSRRSLWTEAHREIPSADAVLAAAASVLDYLPDDVLAGFYAAAVSEDPRALNAFFDGISVIRFADDLPVMLDFALKIMKPQQILSVKSLIDRGLSGDAKTEYFAKVETLAEKLLPRIHDASRSRAVYVVYSPKDVRQVGEIVSYLENCGISCFVALRNMKYGSGGGNMRETMHVAAEHCTCVLFVSTDTSRSLSGDAMKVELPYILQSLPEKSRIEYIAEEYSMRTKSAAKSFLRDFFSGREGCTSPDDLVNLIRSREKREAQVETAKAPEPAVDPMTALLEEGKRFLEAEDFESAAATGNRILKMDSESALGYLICLLADKKLSSADKLISYPMPFDKDENFVKAFEFADNGLAETLHGYVVKNREKSEKSRKDTIYKDAQAAMKDAETESDFRAVLEVLSRIPDYKDTEELMAMCKRKIADLQSEASILLETRRFAERREAARMREEAEAHRKKMVKNLTTVGVSVVLVGVLVLLWFTAISPAIDYGKASKLMEKGQYAEAQDAFAKMGKYKDAELNALLCGVEIRNAAAYEKATALYEQGDYEGAQDGFKALGNYKDSKTMETKCEHELNYADATALLESGQFDAALTMFNQLGNFKDSRKKAEECRKEMKYAAAMKLFAEGDYAKAKAYFDALKNFRDSAAKAAECAAHLPPEE